MKNHVVPITLLNFELYDTPWKREIESGHEFKLWSRDAWHFCTIVPHNKVAILISQDLIIASLARRIVLFLTLHSGAKPVMELRLIFIPIPDSLFQISSFVHSILFLSHKIWLSLCLLVALSYFLLYTLNRYGIEFEFSHQIQQSIVKLWILIVTNISTNYYLKSIRFVNSVCTSTLFS